MQGTIKSALLILILCTKKLPAINNIIGNVGTYFLVLLRFTIIQTLLKFKVNFRAFNTKLGERKDGSRAHEQTILVFPDPTGVPWEYRMVKSIPWRFIFILTSYNIK